MLARRKSSKSAKLGGKRCNLQAVWFGAIVGLIAAGRRKGCEAAKLGDDERSILLNRDSRSAPHVDVRSS